MTETETTEYWNAAPHPQLAHLPQLPHPLNSKVVTATVPATATKKLPTTQIGRNSELKIKLNRRFTYPWMDIVSPSYFFQSIFQCNLNFGIIPYIFFPFFYFDFECFVFSFHMIQYQYRLI